MKKERSFVLVAGYFGFGNAGDELILSSVLKHTGVSSWKVLSGRPSWTKDLCQVAAINRWDPFQVLAGLWQCQALLVAGGELIQTRTSLRSLWFYLGLVGVARFLGRPVFVNGLGVDTDIPRRSLWVTHFFLRGVTFLSFRDEPSQKTLRFSGARLSSHVVPDPVWALAPRFSRHRPQSHNILWALRFGAPGVSVENRLLKELNSCSGQKVWDHRFLSLDPVREAKCFGRFRSALTFFHKAVFWQNPEHLFNIFEGHGLIVTSRFHGLVLAAKVQRPVLLISFHSKLARLGKTLGAVFLDPTLLGKGLLEAHLQKARERGPLLPEKTLDKLRMASRENLTELGKELQKVF